MKIVKFLTVSINFPSFINEGKKSILDYTRTKTTWINISDDPMKNPFVMR